MWRAIGVWSARRFLQAQGYRQLITTRGMEK